MGISAMVNIKSKSDLLRGEVWQEDAEPEFQLMATASFGAKEFRLWKLSNALKTLHPYLKIETTIVGGIKFLIETQDTQIVAANSKCIKFYDFIDKNDKEAKEKQRKAQEELNAEMKEHFKSVDKMNVMKLDKANMRVYFKLLHEKMGDQFEVASSLTEECFDDVWHEMDFNETGFITWH